MVSLCFGGVGFYFEATCSKGFLTQAMREHMRLGGYNPKELHREQLLAAGVPIQAAATTKRGTPKKNHKPCGSFLLFKAAEEAKRENTGQSRRGFKSDKATYSAWLTSVKERWQAMTEEERTVWLEKVAVL